ncbi:MAG: hypothetical protein GWO08_18395 [Gammaproteobacteria bacterium]|nr:hypothetical protein [candidate division Zixibacteria bacterium]NIR95534.1 hypothetical protein [Gammaproteobacteria bacterium]NIU15957.1 hypothetical protein [candidate division Zixibacteria bacterium]NIW47377.1 hypothetical protein [Gammaproteobacteria bacterium]
MTELINKPKSISQLFRVVFDTELVFAIMDILLKDTVMISTGYVEVMKTI